MDSPAGDAQDPRWQDSEPGLVQLLRDEIDAAPEMRVTFARFMQRVLTEPGLGYYATSDRRPTRTGDFLTAPELHPFFGRCLGRFLDGGWQAAGKPGHYLVEEHGAGRGILRDSVIEGLRRDASGLADAISWRALDLPQRGEPPDDGAVVDVVVANEFLDALPVHRLVQRTRLLEVYVGWQDGWFSDVEAEPSSAALAETLAADGVGLVDGQRAEVCLEAGAWLRAIAERTRLLLVIDYGHDAAELYGPRRRAGSLLTYRGHQPGDDPYAAVGRSDITAHVDITALQREAGAAGLRSVGDTSQARFLTSLGLGDLLADLGRQPGTDMQAYLEARSAVARLLDPRHLGGFRVLAWSDPEADAAATRLPGLSGED